MNKTFSKLALCAGLALMGVAAHAQQDAPPAASGGIAAKMIVRGELLGLQTVDLRSTRRNDVMVVQAEIVNMDTRDVRMYYRFRWLDAGGMQVGDGEVWKPLVFLGKQSQFIKGTAYSPLAADFRIEMSAEPR